MSGAATAFSRAAAAALNAPSLAPAPTRAQLPGRNAAVRAPRRSLAMLIGGAMIWLLMVMMIVPEGFDYSHLAVDGDPTSGGKLNRLLWTLLLAGGLLIIFTRAALASKVMRTLNPFLAGIVVLALASVAWSMDPAVTVRRLFRVVTIVFAALAFVLADWHPLRLQSVLRSVITAVLIGSLFFGLAWPEYATHQEPGGPLDGAWRGLASHKNSFGDLACMGLIFWFHAWLSRQAHVLSALAGMALAVTCLLLAHSSTSLMASAFTLIFLALMLRAPATARRYLPAVVAVFIGALLIYSLVTMHIVPGLTLLVSPLSAISGKDVSFTGRTEIWDIVLAHIRLHPFLGSGYGAFWTGAVEGSPSFEFIQHLAFYPGSSHNGYLEILNDLGALGVLLLLAYLVTFVRQALRLLPVDRTHAALFLALFMQQAIMNLSESRWFSALSVDFVIMTLATFVLARALLESAHTQRPA